MKASIDERGCLRIQPETALESYALGAWLDGWERPAGAQTSVFHVERKFCVTPSERIQYLPYCNNILRAAGKKFLRTCLECGDGPCRVISE